MAMRGGGGCGVRQTTSPQICRVGGSGPQPMRATVPFHLQNRDSRSAVGKPPHRHRVSCISHASSLDTVIAPYLLGQWPRDIHVPVTGMNDKATQTPTSWSEAELENSSCSPKRSASWGSLDHRKEFTKLRLHLQRTTLNSHSGKEELHSPLHGETTVSHGMQVTCALTAATLLKLPRLHRSLEGLNKELEELFKHQGGRELVRVMDVPDGHRAPEPVQHCIGGFKSDPSLTQVEHKPFPSSALLAASPASHSDASQRSPIPTEAKTTVTDGLEMDAERYSPSPKPNHSCMFKREPPEGCERVKVVEEAVSCMDNVCSCPDKNKVHFIPTGTAFYPFDILKHPLPTMDFLFRNLPTASSTVISPGTLSSCQTVSHSSFHGSGVTSGVEALSEQKPQSLQRVCWKRTQAEDGNFLHSSLVV
ncbi:protein FAM117A [Protopterus annectens]|uniref:protein FAM117A n=1 Tax=Protopterus annectens TaxID=7888 RepID=UPI001CFB7492|nr:protein FAM117A [Protopterus annectens]